MRSLERNEPFCDYANGRGSRPDHGGDPRDEDRRQNQFERNFKFHAENVADSVIQATKQLEPYVNNSEEVILDDLKKQATRLRAHIKGGRDLKIVRNTMYHLGILLAEHEEMLMNKIETDRLDHLAEELITSAEMIQSLVDFLDNGFTGNRSDLY